MPRFCATRLMKNAKFIRSVAPHVIPPKEPAAGFASLVPVDILRRFHALQEADLSGHPELLEALRTLHAAALKPPLSPAGSLQMPNAQPVAALEWFGDPPFQGTLHFVKVTFFQEANGAQLAVSDADLATAIQYMTLAAPAVSAYCSQYGKNRIDVSPTVLQIGLAVTSGLYNDDAVQSIVNDVVRQNHLPHDSSCIIFINPPGMLNTDGNPESVAGYHDKADAAYCFINAGSFGFTVEDRRDSYAATLTHEVAEMVCDPGVSIFNKEACDGCDTNCNNFTWRNFFLNPSPSLANSFLQATHSIPADLNFSYYITGIARPRHAGDCPASQSSCAYPPPRPTDAHELLFYDPGAGTGEFYALNNQGDITIQVQHPEFRPSWTRILSGHFSDQTFGTTLLFYDAAGHTGEFYGADITGNMAQVGASNTDWRSSWAQIVKGHFSNSPFDDLLFYDRSAGVGEFYNTGHGSVSRIGAPNTGWRQSWSLIIPGKFSAGSFTDLLFYDPDGATGEFWRTDGHGNVSLIGSNTGWRSDWSIIVPGNFTGGPFTDLLFYEPSTGTGELWRTDGHGNVSRIASHTNWRRGWSMIIPGNFSGGNLTDLLFYEPSTGTGEFWKSDGHGNISLIRNYTDWRQSWTAIVSLL
jgi:hypothetical protein